MLMIVCGVAIYTGYDVLDFSFSFQMSAFIKILQNYLTTKDLQDKKIYELHQVIIQ
ncbi:hypothetical protein O3M35_004958 [Rhynocoris fuscipes]|uniref:Uncharacterized protein n=1 Tax=Rhynocoris fuscipes TaxID=488301 RepID=A0AAW1DGT1_9HEMI